MNKKIYCFTLICLISINFVFTNDIENYNKNKQILPINDYIGQVDFGNKNSLSNFVLEMFRQNYNTDWIESYVKDDYKYVFTKKYSKMFLELLPLNDPIYCSKQKIFKNNRAVSILFEKNKIITLLFDIEENKIINVDFS